MRSRWNRRLWARDGDPGPLAWIVASISLILPIVGVVLCLFGVGRLFRAEQGGLMLVGSGAALIALDILIDVLWAHPAVSESDQPNLNRRSAQLLGRVAIVVEDMADGEGRVRVGDTLWPAEGVKAKPGDMVRIVAACDRCLVVEAVPDVDASG